MKNSKGGLQNGNSTLSGKEILIIRGKQIMLSSSFGILLDAE